MSKFDVSMSMSISINLTCRCRCRCRMNHCYHISTHHYMCNTATIDTRAPRQGDAVENELFFSTESRVNVVVLYLLDAYITPQTGYRKRVARHPRTKTQNLIQRTLFNMTSYEKIKMEREREREKGIDTHTVHKLCAHSRLSPPRPLHNAESKR